MSKIMQLPRLILRKANSSTALKLARKATGNNNDPAARAKLDVVV